VAGEAAMTARFLGMTITPLIQRRLAKFRANKRGYWSFWVFLALFLISLFAEFIANDRPLLVYYDGSLYVPIVKEYPETAFGGFFPSAANYRDPYLQELIAEQGWMLWPPIRFSYDTINYNLPVPAPAPPSAANWLGTDDQGRDVLARLIYGFRISILFGLLLTIVSSIIGVAAGAVQGYFGGWTDRRAPARRRGPPRSGSRRRGGRGRRASTRRRRDGVVASGRA
jgi:microcin C transport system permease protein